jgi:hypothetical protein
MGYHERLQARIYELEAALAKLQAEYDAARNEIEFIITRTSEYRNDVKPCDEAHEEVFNNFYSRWKIKLSPDELLEFSEKYGEIIISAHCFADTEYPSIEIYDDYRE